MPKILQINITCGVGSTGKLSQALYEATIANGYEARFAYSAFQPAIESAFPIENKFQNYLRRGLNKYFGMKQVHSNPGTCRLIRYIKREKPDLIHLHNVQQNSVNYIKLFQFLKNSGIPCVYTMHDCWPFTGSCYHFTKIGCNEFRSECSDCVLDKHSDDVTSTPKKSYSLKADLIGANDNIHMVAVSNWLKDASMQSYMSKMKHPPVTIYNGIDTSIFHPVLSGIRGKLGINDDEVVIVSVAGYWTKEKGINLILELAQRLPIGYHLMLLGNIAHDIELPKNIINIGNVSDKNHLAQYYSCADILLNTSIEETFGMTTAEAMACGTPAIVMNSTACPEIIDKKTGYVVDGSIDSILDAIYNIVKRGSGYYTEECVNRVSRMFLQSRMQREYLELYRCIINGNDKK